MHQIVIYTMFVQILGFNSWNDFDNFEYKSERAISLRFQW